MNPAALALILTNLPAIIQVSVQAAAALKELYDRMQQAQDEGRELTAEDLARFALTSDGIKAAWDNRAG